MTDQVDIPGTGVEVLLAQYKIISDHLIYENQLKITLFRSFLIFNGTIVGMIHFSGGINFKIFSSILGIFGCFLIWLMMVRSFLHIQLRNDQLRDVEARLRNMITSFKPMLSVSPQPESVLPGGISTRKITKNIPIIGIILWVVVSIFHLITGYDFKAFLKGF